MNLDIQKMKKDGFVTTDEVYKKWMKDPEFRRLQKENKPRRDLIISIVRSRIDKDLTQQELAEIVGMKQSSVARIESGNANPRFSTIKKIADGLGKTLKVTLE